MEESIDLRDYARIIRKRLKIVIALPLIALLTSGILSFFVLKPVYQASALVIVGKTADAQPDNSLAYNSVMANQLLAQTYQSIATSRVVLQRVADQVGNGLTPDTLAKDVTVEAVKNTEIISINVNNANPQLAADIANKLTAEFSQRVKEIKKVDGVGVVDPAVAPTKPTKPNKKLNLALALVLGLFVAVGLVFLLEYLDNTVKTSDEVEELTGLTVLGTIPQFSVVNHAAK